MENTRVSFEWTELQGRTFKCHVGEDIESGLKSTVVFLCSPEGNSYLVHADLKEIPDGNS